LLASDSSDNDTFGRDVSIYGDYIVVGAFRNNTPPYIENGAVYIYKKNDNGSYGDPSGSVYIENYKLLASDLSDEDWFGVESDIYGDYIVVGATRKDIPPHEDNGAAYVFKKQLTTN